MADLLVFFFLKHTIPTKEIIIFLIGKQSFIDQIKKIIYSHDMEEEPHYFFFLFWLVITHALGGSWILNPFYHLAVTRERVTYELELSGEDEPHYILFLHSTPTQHSKNGCCVHPQTTS